MLKDHNFGEKSSILGKTFLDLWGKKGSRFSRKILCFRQKAHGSGEKSFQFWSVGKKASDLRGKSSVLVKKILVLRGQGSQFGGKILCFWQKVPGLEKKNFQFCEESFCFGEKGSRF